MNKSVRSGAIVGVLVASAILGTWLLATSVSDNRARVELQRLQPPPLQAAPCDQEQADEKPAHPGTIVSADAARATGSSRDTHFTQVLDQLASRQRQESFEAIFNGNAWGCGTLGTLDRRRMCRSQHLHERRIWGG